MNSLKIDKAIISNNNIENENNGKEIWLNNEETKRNAIDKFKNNDPFYQKNSSFNFFIMFFFKKKFIFF